MIFLLHLGFQLIVGYFLVSVYPGWKWFQRTTASAVPIIEYNYVLCGFAQLKLL